MRRTRKLDPSTPNFSGRSPRCRMLDGPRREKASFSKVDSRLMKRHDEYSLEKKEKTASRTQAGALHWNVAEKSLGGKGE